MDVFTFIIHLSVDEYLDCSDFLTVVNCAMNVLFKFLSDHLFKIFLDMEPFWERTVRNIQMKFPVFKELNLVRENIFNY